MLFTLTDRQLIAAPIHRVFALSTSVPVVQRTLGFTPVAGVTQGRVKAGSRVLWQGWLFGLPQRHLTLITDYAPPHFEQRGYCVAWFQDTQESGRFASFQHDHHMLGIGPNFTVLQDEIRFALPLGFAGALVARWILLPFIRRTLRSRMDLLDRLASTGEGDQYVRRGIASGGRELRHLFRTRERQSSRTR